MHMSMIMIENGVTIINIMRTRLHRKNQIHYCLSMKINEKIFSVMSYFFNIGESGLKRNS